MGRTHTPTAILDAKGSFLKHPDRKRPGEPKPSRPLGPPPKYLSDGLKAIWKEVAKRLLPGVASEADRDAFEMMVRLTATMRDGGTKVGDVVVPMMAAERSTLISLWSRFAMTPADRSKVVVEKPKDSKLDAFMKRRKQSQPPVEPPSEENSLIN
jgi:phage terminase small subunit